MERNRGRIYPVVFLLGALAGIVLLGALRFALQPAVHAVHHHANWAVFVDGQRLDLTANRYMEDVFQCSVDPTQQRPEDRAHMHEGNHDVVHVHSAGVTWGHFLANLGFAVGDDFLYADEARYQTGNDGRSLKFILNGSPVRSIRNLPIGDQDRLLISFGAESVEAVTEAQFAQVGSDAPEYNVMPDPASCSGAHEETLGERVRRAMWY